MVIYVHVRLGRRETEAPGVSCVEDAEVRFPSVECGAESGRQDELVRLPSALSTITTHAGVNCNKTKTHTNTQSLT